MNIFHSWYLTATRYRYKTELWDLFWLTTGTSANDAWYNCYLFYYDFYGTYKRKYESFTDFGDIYLSFIFNMLENVLNLRSQTINMIDSYAKHDTEKFV